MSNVKQGYQDLMALKDSLKSARELCRDTRKAKDDAKAKGWGNSHVECADAHLAALTETLKAAEKQAKLAHGALAEGRTAAMANGDPDPGTDDDIPVT